MTLNSQVVEFCVLFTKQKIQKSKTWHDGTLKFYKFNNKVQLYDESNALMADEFLTRDAQMAEGNKIDLACFIVDLAYVIREYSRDVSGIVAKKKAVPRVKQEHDVGVPRALSPGMPCLKFATPFKTPVKRVGAPIIGLGRKIRTPKQKTVSKSAVQAVQGKPQVKSEVAVEIPKHPATPLGPQIRTTVTSARFQTSRRHSKIRLGLPRTVSSRRNTPLEAEVPRKSKKKSLSKIMKINGPPRRIEIPHLLNPVVTQIVKKEAPSPQNSPKLNPEQQSYLPITPGKPASIDPAAAAVPKFHPITPNSSSVDVYASDCSQISDSDLMADEDSSLQASKFITQTRTYDYTPTRNNVAKLGLEISRKMLVNRNTT